MTQGPGPYVMVIVFDNSDWALSPVICGHQAAMLRRNLWRPVQ